MLLTNVEKDPETHDSRYILETYKNKHGIEQDFRFLKDPVIVNRIFLKKPERIAMLGLVLLASLLLWRLIERSMRQYIEENGEKLLGWVENQLIDPPLL